MPVRWSKTIAPANRKNRRREKAGCIQTPDRHTTRSNPARPDALSALPRYPKAFAVLFVDRLTRGMSAQRSAIRFSSWGWVEKSALKLPVGVPAFSAAPFRATIFCQKVIAARGS